MYVKQRVFIQNEGNQPLNLEQEIRNIRDKAITEKKEIEFG